jgi:hypothetical protein
MTDITLDEDPMSDPGRKLDDLLESSDEELSDSDADPDSSMSDESFTSSNFSASGLSFRENARLEKDEKRLHLDLKRHRQLIVDSQKMNQALKRCMTWAEEMIAEGRRALEYKVQMPVHYKAVANPARSTFRMSIWVAESCSVTILTIQQSPKT